MRALFPASTSLTLAMALSFVLAGGVAFGEITGRDKAALSQASLIYIATVRKDGNQSTAAPVWFTTADGDILIQTGPTTWKAKRVRRGSSPFIVWIGKRDGPALIAKAQITNDRAVISKIVTDYPKKYLLARIGYHKPTAEMFTKGQVVAIRITPVRDLPSGFTSAPGTSAPKLNEPG
jgi:predicted pyridoxine 5'-phosphate oxidase superfamily flavin-nucleotide-binding protein